MNLPSRFIILFVLLNFSVSCFAQDKIDKSKNLFYNQFCTTYSAKQGLLAGFKQRFV